MSRLPEQKSWDAFSNDLNRRVILPVRIENLLRNGTPDVLCLNKNGAVFWLENKAMEKFPARQTTVVLPESKFEPGQLSFLRSWMVKGGKCFVLLRVGTTHYLLDPKKPIEFTPLSEFGSIVLAEGKRRIYDYLERIRNEQN